LQVSVTDTLTTCTSNDSVRIYVVPPLENINFDTTIVIGDSIQLPIDNQNGFVTFFWTPDTALSCLQCSNPWHQGFEDIIYTVDMEDVIGCYEAKGIFNIHVNPNTFIDLPTTFTPNGDGVNDIIYLRGWGIKEVVYFRIFNRWGEMVFESTNIDHGWDGYYKGVLQNNDTYTYTARVKTFRNEYLDGRGHINLMR
jgi:gliding motility-associated-like protein